MRKTVPKIRALLLAAMQRLVVVEFDYEGIHRMVELHRWGEVENGRIMYEGYQLNPGGRQNKLPGWRNYHEDKIENLTITERHYQSHAGYNPASHKFKRQLGAIAQVG